MPNISSDYDPIFQKVGQKYNIDPDFLKAVAYYESGLNPKFKNPQSSAKGLGAFTDATAKDYNVDVNDPESSIDGMGRYMSNNYAKFKNSNNPVVTAVSAYKTGPNAGTVDNQYVGNIMDIYDGLKKNSTPDTDSPEDAVIKKWRSYAAAAQQPVPENNDSKTATPADQAAIAKFRSYDQSRQSANSNDSDTSNSSPAPDEPIAVKSSKSTINGEAPPPDPNAYKNLSHEQQAAMSRGEAAYGMGDTPRSLAKVAYAVAPDTFDSVVKAAVPAYAKLTGQPAPDQSELDATTPAQDQQTYNNALTQRNADFKNQYGNDPNAGINRFAGNLITAGPVMGAAGKAAGLAADGLGAVSPALGKAADFLGGRFESNAVIDPATGVIRQASTLGNKIGQYLSKGSAGVGLSVPATAASAAGDEKPLDKQFEQNAVMSGALGTLAPAVWDGSAYVGNKISDGIAAAGGKVSPETENARNLIEQFAGGGINNADTTEYVPGSKPTLAQAAAHAGDPNAGGLSALEEVMSEGSSKAPNLYNQSFKDLANSNNVARRKYALDLVGDPSDITDLQETRADNANKLMGNEAKRLADPTLPKGTVWQNNTDADPTPILDYINKVRDSSAKGNSGLMDRLDKMETLLNDPSAKDPQYLYESFVKPQITDVLDKTDPFKADNATKSQLPFLKQIKSLADNTIQQAAPGYKNYLNQYTQDSRAVERAQGLQSLGLVNPEAENSFPTLNRVNQALQKIQKGRTNIDPTDPFKSLTNNDVNKLRNLQSDLTRQQSASKLLEGRNSATSQKLRFAAKVNDHLDPTPSDVPSQVLGTLGAVAGEGIGSGLGHPWVLGSPLAYTGSTVGKNIGKKLAQSFVSKKSAAADEVSNMLLSPHDYLNAPTSTNKLFMNSGDSAPVSELMRRAAPYGAVGVNRLLLGTGVPGAGNSQ